VRWFTPAIKQVLRLIPSDMGRPIGDLASTLTGSDIESEARHVLDTLVPVETEVSSDDDRHFIRRVLPYRTSDNRIDGIVATFVDITEHKRAQRLRERLMHELSHRIKNTLATVQAIVQGLGQRSASLPEFLDAFEPRLAALARAHSLLMQPDDERIDLRQMICRELEPYLGKSSARIKIEGDPLAIDRGAAIALELVFHELVTNAIKYGALSNETGTIAVRWDRIGGANGSRARLKWIESGGPPVKSPSKSGFGSLLIQSSVAHDLAGIVITQYEPTGLQCTIEFPSAEGAADETRDQTAQESPTAVRRS